METLLGVADMTYKGLAVDVVAGRSVGSFRPYLGATLLNGRASETTSKVNLNNETAKAWQWLVGSEYNWKRLSMALEADFGVIKTYSVKFGVSF